MTRTPDVIGVDGRVAWQSRLSPEGSGRLDVFILEVPGAHPVTSRWLVSVVHLRDIDGAEPATKVYPQAEYEIAVAALDPSDTEVDGGGWKLAKPLEMALQFHGVNDRQAMSIARAYVAAVLVGNRSPVRDHSEHWQQCISKCVARFQSKAAHQLN